MDAAYENRSPFELLNGTLLSYLLFSNTLWFSVAGACLVGAGSLLDSWLGDPAVSVLAGPPFSAAASLMAEASSESAMAFFLRCSIMRAWRSALMFCLAK